MQEQLHIRGTATLTRYSYTKKVPYCPSNEVKLHPRGTVTPTRYSNTYEVQQHLRGTATPTRYSNTYEVQLHLRGKKCTYKVQPDQQGTVQNRYTNNTATPPGTATSTRYIRTFETQPHLRGTFTPTYNHNYEVRLN